MLKVLIQPEYLAFPNQKQVPTGILIQVLLFLRFALLKAVRSSFDDLKFKIFQGYSLFSYQCSLLFSATLIYYHNHLHLSTTFLFCFASFSKQFVVTRLRQLVNNTKPSFVCQQLFSSFYFMNVRITCPDSLPIHLNIDVRRRYFPRGEYYTNIIFFGCQHTFFIFYTYILLKFLL